MNFYLSIEMDNAAFEDDSDNELGLVLHRVIKAIQNGNSSGLARDTNGNTVGNWRIS